MTCDACAKAVDNPYSGAIDNGCHGCHGCQVRFLAKAPKHVRQAIYEMEARTGGSDALMVLKDEVRREYERLKELRSV